MATRTVVSVLSTHAACRRGLASLVERKGVTTVECATLAQLSASARRAITSIVDLDHLDQDGASWFAAARALGPAIPVGTAARQAASITTLADVGVEPRALEPGAFAQLTDRRRASSELARQFKLWQRITPRQRSVMRLLAVGRDNRRIAAALDVGERAIKAHVSALLALFGLDNRTELALLAYDAGLR